jgi:hypothetical protein
VPAAGAGASPSPILTVACSGRGDPPPTALHASCRADLGDARRDRGAQIGDQAAGPAASLWIAAWATVIADIAARHACSPPSTAARRPFPRPGFDATSRSGIAPAATRAVAARRAAAPGPHARSRPRWSYRAGQPGPGCIATIRSSTVTDGGLPSHAGLVRVDEPAAAGVLHPRRADHAAATRPTPPPTRTRQ